MDTQPAPAKTPPKSLAARFPANRKCKYNRNRVKALAQQGVSPTAIANDQGVHLTTISRYLKSVEAQIDDTKRYINIRADSLAFAQLGYQTIANMILRNWINNPQLLLTHSDIRLQKEVLIAVQGAKHYDFLDERVERGESIGVLDYRIQAVSVQADFDTARRMLDQARALKSGKVEEIVISAEVNINDNEALP